MTWLDRPAAVYTRHEVVLHRLDTPLITVQTGDRGQTTTYEIWEGRIIYSFDPMSARWAVSVIEQMGNRKGSRMSRIGVPGRHPEVVQLAERYMPDWVPEPSQKRLRLPAEDVWDEACDTLRSAPVGPAVQDAAVRLKERNPYRGE